MSAPQGAAMGLQASNAATSCGTSQKGARGRAPLQDAELVPEVLAHSGRAGGWVAMLPMAQVAAEPVGDEQVPVLVGLAPLLGHLGLHASCELGGVVPRRSCRTPGTGQAWCTTHRPSTRTRLPMWGRDKQAGARALEERERSMRDQSQFMHVSPSLWMRCMSAPASSRSRRPSAWPSRSEPSASCRASPVRQPTRWCVGLLRRLDLSWRGPAGLPTQLAARPSRCRAAGSARRTEPSGLHMPGVPRGVLEAWPGSRQAAVSVESGVAPGHAPTPGRLPARPASQIASWSARCCAPASRPSRTLHSAPAGPGRDAAWSSGQSSRACRTDSAWPAELMHLPAQACTSHHPAAEQQAARPQAWDKEHACGSLICSGQACLHSTTARRGGAPVSPLLTFHRSQERTRSRPA